MVDGFEQAGQAADVQESFLLAGERGFRQVLGRCRRTDGHREVGRLACCHDLPGRGDVLLHGFRQRRVEDPLTDAAAGCGELLHVADIEVAQARLDPRGKAILGEEGAKGIGGGGKAVGHPDAEFRELAEEFAERGVLAADPGHVGHGERPQWNDGGIQWASSIMAGHDAGA